MKSWAEKSVYLIILMQFFSSSEPKVQVSFSDHSLSIVRRRRFSRKLLTLSSSPKLLDQFQPNMLQSIIGWKAFTFAQMKDHALPRGDIKEWKYINEIEKSSSPEPLGEFQSNLVQSIFTRSRFKFI